MNKELPSGSTLSRYRVVSKIGAGGMGEAYVGEDTRLHRKVALKILPGARMASAAPLSFNAPAELFDGPYTLDLLGHQREDISSDGRRFLVVGNSDDFPIIIVQNWPLELGRLVK